MAAEVDEVLGRLRRHGGRITSARRALVTALVNASCHMTAEELAAVVNGPLPDVVTSTIYRALDDLEGLGIVAHVHLGHGPAAYYLTERGCHHLSCQVCGAVIEVATTLLDPSPPPWPRTMAL